MNPGHVEAAAREYDQAWNRHDLDTIIARHREDGTYRSHTAGAPVIRGRSALRTAFSEALANWTKLSFHLDRVLCGDGFYVWQATLHGVLARPLSLGSLEIPANGTSLTFTGVDIVTLDAGGLIANKDSYFDLVGAVNQATQDAEG